MPMPMAKRDCVDILPKGLASSELKVDWQYSITMLGA